jgi:Protein of unknown function (DUF1592)/Protein of unknown function (DUF1588)/Protein of unknown function (DUF1595)/Protein of unknown function (DUF1587)/Protein of unknown function (DUF1585)
MTVDVRAPAVALAALILAGCNGSIGGDGTGTSGGPAVGGPSQPGGPGGPGGPGSPGPGPVGPGPGGSGPGAGPTSSCSTIDPGPSPLRRLTRIEYDNTVQMLLGTSSRPAAELFPADEEQFGFDNSAEGRGLNGALAEGYLKAAERLSKEAVGKLASLLPCDPAAKSEAICLDQFLDGFGQRAWRRPLDAAEKDNLRQAFANGKGAGGFAAGIDAVIQVMLMSPQFLYRDERGVEEAGTHYRRLTSWELASRLSYLIWGSMPDDQLFDAARDGKLSTREQIADQARRLVKDDRALGMMNNFYGQWLQLRQLDSLSKEPEAFPAFKQDTARLMRQETETLVRNILAGDGNNAGKLEALFTANYTFVNGPLAAYYGAPDVIGTDWKKVELHPGQRAGILTQGGFLASHATPEPGLTALIFRGVFVREQLLCEPLPEPPADAAEMSPPVTATTTPRSWSKERMAIGACGTCHQLFDPIGYGFEGWNEIGLPVGKTVDTSGHINGTDVSGPYNGPVELGKKLAGSKQAQDCAATQWFRFANGRMEDSARDACSLNSVKAAFQQSGGDLKELLVALTQTDAFLLRSKGEAP